MIPILVVHRRSTILLFSTAATAGASLLAGWQECRIAENTLSRQLKGEINRESWQTRRAAHSTASGQSQGGQAGHKLRSNTREQMIQQQQQQCPQVAEPADELFEIVEEDGTSTGRLVPRHQVHSTGLLHKAVYCFVFDKRGRLLIQRRSPDKKIGPNQWDLSVAEHLSPGETHKVAAERGLQEELGITATLPAQPIAPLHKRQLLVPGRYIDNELVESYKLEGFEGQVQYNRAEVSDVQYIELHDLQHQMEAEPDKFTEWFRDEMQLLGFFGLAQQQQQQQEAAAAGSS